MAITKAELARYLDVTLLAPTATQAEVEQLCVLATEVGAFAVCVSPSLVATAARAVPTSVAVATVCGFPSGAHTSATKVYEAANAVEAGAVEVDMVLNLGLVKAADFVAVQREISAVRTGALPALLKVIIESAALTDTEIVACCQAALAAGADFVKTSTGFHPAGGASVDAVSLMARTVGGQLGVKASGGIGTTAQAQAMIAAGATRLGVSRAAAVLADAVLTENES